MASDPTVVLVQDGKTYLFSTEEAKTMFTADSAKMIAMADKSWPTVAHQGH